MPYPAIFPSGLLLQTPQTGSGSRPYSGLAMVMTAGTDLELGALVMIDASDTETVIPIDAATPHLLVGVVVGSANNATIDYDGSPASGEKALIAVPPCRVKARLGATVAAGAAIMVDTTDGRLTTWTDANVRLGYTIEGGDDGDLVSVHFQPSVAATALGTAPIETYEAGATLEIGTLVSVDPADETTLIALDAANSDLFFGVVTGMLVDGVVEATAPDAADTAVVALPCCVTDVILDETVAAGCGLMPASVDGRVVAWTPGNYLVGHSLEGGDQDDLVSAYIHPAQVPYAGPVAAYTSGATIAIGSLVMADPSDTSEVLALDAATPDLMVGVLIGSLVDGRIDRTAVPDAADTAVIALPSGVMNVILDETVADGCALMPATVDGRVVAWTPGSYLVGYAITGGDQDDVVSAYIHPAQMPYDGQVWTRVAGATLPLGSLVEVEAAVPTDCLPLDATTPYLFAGVVIGELVNGRIDRTAVPDEGDVAVIAIPPCVVDVILDATIAAGVPIMPDADTDGRVEAWTDTNSMVGFLLEGGDQNDVVSAYITPIKLYVTE